MSGSRSPQRWDVALRASLESGLEAWGHTVTRFRWQTIAVMLAFAAAFGSQLPKIEIETSTEALLHESDPARIVYDDFRRQFGREQVILITLRPEEIFDLAFLDRLRALHEDLEAEVPHLEEVSSLVNARETRGVGDELVVRDLLAQWPESAEDLARLRERVLANPLYRNFLVSEAGDLTTIMVKSSAYSSLGEGEDDELAGFSDPDGFADDPATAAEPLFLTGAEAEEVARAVQEITARHSGPGFELHTAGGPMMSYRITGQMRRNMALFALLSHLVIAALLFALFRRLSAVILPLTVVTLSVLSTFGAMAAWGTPLGIPTQILPSFLLAVGVGAGVHLLVIFFQSYDAGATREESIAHALGHSGLAIVMTGLTTAGGLVSFYAAEIAPVADLGIFAPVGILLGLVYCLVLLPALLAALPLSRRTPEATRSSEDWIDRTLLWVGDRCTSRPWTVVSCMSVILLVALAGTTRLSFTYDPLRWLPENDDVRLTTLEIDRDLQGATALEILVDTGRENGLHDPEILQGLEALRLRVAGLRGDEGLRAGKTLSIADMAMEIHQALNENRPEYYAIPSDRALVAQELLLFENSGSDDLDELVDSQFQRARFTVKLPYSPPLLFEQFIDETMLAFEDVLGDGVEVTPTGFVTLMTRSLNAVNTSMLRSYGIALAIITPLMFLLLGSLRGGTAAMVPNLAPIILTLGFMGWMGIPLDLFTLLIGSIAIGLAVDDTIHFMHNFRKYYEESEDVHLAVRETLRTTGHALLVTSIVLSLSFFIYMFADLRNLVLFGLLTGFTILSAFVADITISPALMALSTRGDRLAAERMRTGEGRLAGWIAALRDTKQREANPLASESG